MATEDAMERLLKAEVKKQGEGINTLYFNLKSNVDDDLNNKLKYMITTICGMLLLSCYRYRVMLPFVD